MVDPLRVYFAGSLFHHKDLAGNLLLADAIETNSGQRYRCILPQNFETPDDRAVSIRNKDFAQLISCDLALFDFNGSELDAGTVAEFMMAKFLDIPAVIHRSDFRASGDQGTKGEAWILMCSFYPRTRTVSWNSMVLYQEARETHTVAATLAGECARRMAVDIVAALDAVHLESPLPRPSSEWRQSLLTWVAQCLGGGMAELLEAKGGHPAPDPQSMRIVAMTKTEAVVPPPLVPPLTERFLQARGILPMDYRVFLHGTLEDLPDPFLMAGMEAAVENAS
jgi:hypothetical protein